MLPRLEEETGGGKEQVNKEQNDKGKTQKISTDHHASGPLDVAKKAYFTPLQVGPTGPGHMLMRTKWISCD